MMSRRRRRGACAAAGWLLPLAAMASDCGSLEPLQALLGEWRSDGKLSIVHESWRRLGPATFEGTGVRRSQADGSVRAAEDLRLLQMAGQVFYVAKVAENPLPVAFRLTACGDGVFVFENPAHDFPRRLEYRLGPPDRLAVRVSDGGEQGFSLAFERAAGADPDLRAAVLAAEDARFAAMVAADPVAMRSAFAADLHYVHSTGRVESREQIVDSIASARMRYRAVTSGEREVVPLGEGAALVRGRGRFEVAAGDAPLVLELRYLAVYVIEDGAWRLQDWQSQRLP